MRTWKVAGGSALLFVSMTLLAQMGTPPERRSTGGDMPAAAAVQSIGEGQNPFLGSRPAEMQPGELKLSLLDASSLPDRRASRPRPNPLSFAICIGRLWKSFSRPHRPQAR